ncbi:hypothetical protein Tco_0441316 [Tanacetum coccineum]
MPLPYVNTDNEKAKELRGEKGDGKDKLKDNEKGKNEKEKDDEFGLPALQSTRMTLELANCSLCVPKGIARDVLVPVGRLTFPADFVVVDVECDYRSTYLFGKWKSSITTTRPHKGRFVCIDIFSSPKEKDEDPNAIFTSSEVVKCDFLTTNGDPITPPFTHSIKKDLYYEKVEKHEFLTPELTMIHGKDNKDKRKQKRSKTDKKRKRQDKSEE